MRVCVCVRACVAKEIEWECNEHESAFMTVIPIGKQRKKERKKEKKHRTLLTCQKLLCCSQK
jgi:hypothetical protein